MRLFVLCFALLLQSLTASAETIENDKIPSQITDQVYKKHPNAVNMTAENKTHFAQELVKIQYKEGEEKFVEYYRPDGHFFVSGHIIAADDMMFTDSKEKLKSEFSNYKITNAILIPNPNGSGEEFDVVLETSGKSWNVMIDKKGNVVKSEMN